MKNKRALVVMAVAILFGLTAVVLASRWLLLQPTASAGHIVVAAADTSLGQRLTSDMLKLAEWPADSMPKGAFTDPQKLVGRVLKTSLLAGEPLSEAKLAPVGTLGGLSALITEGKRAITVRVNDVIGVAGFALPGNYVDIIVSTEKDPGPEANAREQNISKIVLERILVLAVAQEVNRDETKPRVVNAVTLEVTPEQAEALDLARSVGTLSLALRNQVDPQSAQTTGATKLTLLPGAPAVVKPAPAKPAAAPRRPDKPAVYRVATPPVRRNCVNVINGLHSSQECF
ncbi:Flp pilus assembly protein CpaB [Massilia sp. Dwa41.01b]|uniref:Flp pilus assembly protein CpaB n=1 Tax=unclassified Massilia TaxID=2609279 RepID=UPI0016018B73|nr:MULTISPECIES: Flp pilus assembly protein CpaB [unclassified Massilia]QNA90795.1 Flp pilus assembly protein CpaB [Massilia sp. Dwa41.01b]QNA98031.1 Flp pilus assembly protein CpaB [Massilia sp. Se16.2.3]